ncbi:MAG: hypothetical protein IT193_16710 [Propionibacteriaceae bacterium]|nr:hypothetical protein [Propionibacteriaceae bacterium]
MATEPSFRQLWGDRPLKPTAQLTDRQIRVAIEELGILLDRETAYDPAHAAYASYEVHASGDVGTIDYLTAGEGLREHRTPAGADGRIRIAPGATVRLFTKEAFELPPDVYASVIGLGQLYAAGLSVGSTYVDPGTRNRIYLSVSNVSDADVIIPVGFPIGRAQFYVLGDRAERLKRGSWRDIPYERGESSPRALAKDVDIVRSELQALRNDVAAAHLPARRSQGQPPPLGIDTSDTNRLQRQLSLLWLAVVVLAGSLAFLILPDQFWLALNGEGISPAARFVITALAPAVVVWLVAVMLKSVRRKRGPDDLY